MGKYKYRSVILVGYDYVIRDVDMVGNESVCLWWWLLKLGIKDGIWMGCSRMKSVSSKLVYSCEFSIYV